MIGSATGRSVLPLHVPAAVLRLAAKADRAFRGAGAKLTPDRASYMCHPDWTARPEMAPPAALWQPRIAAPEGLRQTAEWYRAEGWL